MCISQNEANLEHHDSRKKNKKQKLVKYEPLFIIKGWH